VRLAVIARLGWIRRRRREFQGQERQSSREFVTGESHYIGGRRVRLDLVEHDGPPSVQLKGRTRLELRVRTGSDREKREAVLEAWYRNRVLEAAEGLLAVWEPKIGVEV